MIGQALSHYLIFSNDDGGALCLAEHTLHASFGRRVVTKPFEHKAR